MLMIGLLFFELVFDMRLLFWAVIIACSYAACGLLYFKSLKHNDAGSAIPYIQAFGMLFIFILAIGLLGERPSLINSIGAILLVIGSLLVILKEDSRFTFGKGVLLLCLAAAFEAIYYLLVKRTLVGVHPINLLVPTYFFTALILASVIFFTRAKRLKGAFRFSGRAGYVLLAAVFGSVGTLLIYYALSLGDASRVYPLAGVQSLMIFFMGGLFLKEKFKIKRLLGAFVIFAGVILISI